MWDICARHSIGGRQGSLGEASVDSKQLAARFGLHTFLSAAHNFRLQTMLCSTEFSDQMHTRSVSRVECIPSDGFSLADRGIAPHICTFREDQGGKIQGRPMWKNSGKTKVEEFREDPGGKSVLKWALPKVSCQICTQLQAMLFQQMLLVEIQKMPLLRSVSSKCNMKPTAYPARPTLLWGAALDRIVSVFAAGLRRNFQAGMPSERWPQAKIPPDILQIQLHSIRYFVSQTEQSKNALMTFELSEVSLTGELIMLMAVICRQQVLNFQPK